MIISTDKYAYMSRLKQKNPMYKLVFSMLTLGVCLWANSMAVSILVLVTMGWYTVCRGGMPFAIYVKFLSVPASFLAVSILAIAANISGNQTGDLIYVPLLKIFIGVSQPGIADGMRLALKALGAVSCLYFLSLNTPMVDLLPVLARLRVPKMLIELMGLIYRFIFVFLETAETVVTAQKSRLGYSSIPSGYHALSGLASSLFVRAYKRSQEVYIALEARGYDGELNVLEESFANNRIEYVVPVALNLVLILIAFF